jgi:hypothetical protein
MTVRLPSSTDPERAEAGSLRRHLTIKPWIAQTIGLRDRLTNGCTAKLEQCIRASLSAALAASRFKISEPDQAVIMTQTSQQSQIARQYVRNRGIYR